MTAPRRIELLSPARNLECGIEAVKHGADAVYIGAPKFGARASAGNSVEDIATLAAYAHIYNARVYVTLNTIIKDTELEEVEHLVWELYRAGADALIIQDFGITELKLPPIPLHASTQMDNRTCEKVSFLHKAGFKQVVLARELSLQEIRDIHETCPEVALEVFVHGALCVSYSGKCYASQFCYGRSANRGECAQFCRLPLTLRDADGKAILHNKHLLSLKDLNLSDMLEDLLDAGVTSLKIEGRLKEISYVKNITAYYRQCLDAIFARRKEFSQASSGKCSFAFIPQPDKSFSRGFTHYCLMGRDKNMACFDTPKSLGEEMGTVKEQHGKYLIVDSSKPFHNGDGVCYVDAHGCLHGFRINRVEGNRLFPASDIPHIAPRSRLFRNYDQEFEQTLAHPSSERRIRVSLRLKPTHEGFSLEAEDEDGISISQCFIHAHIRARSSQTDNQRIQLSKLGGTHFEATSFDGREAVKLEESEDYFIPSSILAGWRRKVMEDLLSARRMHYNRETASWQHTTHIFPDAPHDYRANVANSLARMFYKSHLVNDVQPAYELRPVPNAVIMECKYCLRYSLGWCSGGQHSHSPYREPFSLETGNGKRFRLEFDCRKCLMTIHCE